MTHLKKSARKGITDEQTESTLWDADRAGSSGSPPMSAYVAQGLDGRSTQKAWIGSTFDRGHRRLSHPRRLLCSGSSKAMGSRLASYRHQRREHKEAMKEEEQYLIKGRRGLPISPLLSNSHSIVSHQRQRRSTFLTSPHPQETDANRYFRLLRGTLTACRAIWGHKPYLFRSKPFLRSRFSPEWVASWHLRTICGSRS